MSKANILFIQTIIGRLPMVGKSLEFLEIIFNLFDQKALPFTDYMGQFIEMLEIDVKELLGIYTYLLEEGYIKTLRQDRIYITDKGIDILKGVKP
jgi:hypothetical protein